MITMNRTANGGLVTLKIEGVLDTVQAGDFEKEIDDCILTADKLVLDMNGLQYTSSAGLRVILKAQKAMSQKGGMKLIHVSDAVIEVFDITGFMDILTIE